MSAKVIAFVVPMPPVLSERAAKTLQSFDDVGIDVRLVDINRLCFKLQLNGTGLPWDEETRLLEDIDEIRAYYNALQMLPQRHHR